DAQPRLHVPAAFYHFTLRAIAVTTYFSLMSLTNGALLSLLAHTLLTLDNHGPIRAAPVQQLNRLNNKGIEHEQDTPIPACVNGDGDQFHRIIPDRQ
ncbi:MAG: hypothetical protein ABUL58_06320, partial [Steroidobacter sp.]